MARTLVRIVLPVASLAVGALAGAGCAPGSKMNPHGPDMNFIGTPARGSAYTAPTPSDPQSRAPAGGSASGQASGGSGGY